MESGGWNARVSGLTGFRSLGLQFGVWASGRALGLGFQGSSFLV